MRKSLLNDLVHVKFITDKYEVKTFRVMAELLFSGKQKESTTGTSERFQWRITLDHKNRLIVVKGR